MNDQNVLGTAQHVKQANRKTDPVSSQAADVGRAVPRNGNSRIKVRRILSDPIRGAIGNEELRVGKSIRFGAFFAPVSLTRSARACDDIGTHWPSLRFIAVEKPVRRFGLN